MAEQYDTSKNGARSFIRSHLNQNQVVLKSLQSCKLSDNLSVLETKIKNISLDTSFAEHLRGLRAILDCLLAKVNCVDGSTRVVSYIDFGEAFNLYKSYSSLRQIGSANIQTLYDQRKRFKELLLHPEFGLCVYVISFRSNQWITLRSDDLDFEEFFIELIEKANEGSTNRFDLNKENFQNLYKALDTEWDRKIVRVILGANRSRSKLDSLGIDSDSICQDQQNVFDYLHQLGEMEKEAESAVDEELNRRIHKKEELIEKKETLLCSKQNIWSDIQVEEARDDIHELKSAVEFLQSLKMEKETPRKKMMLKRCRKNLIKDRRLKLRRLGSGRKLAMDDEDERMLVDCITDKGTAHGRRQDSVLYLNHRVKKKDFLKIVNVSRKQRELPLIRSATTAYNRSRPKNKRSFQAKKHLGLGLFCCKKPPEAEDNSGILTHYCRAQKKNIIRSLNAAPLDPNFTLYRSYDDKAYLCPGTGTGMMSARSQKVYQPTDPALARKLPKYDFPESMVNCTPGTFLYMNKKVEIVNNEESIKTCDQQTVVVTKPKYFVGSSGIVWASHLTEIKHREPALHEAESPLEWQSKEFRSVMTTLRDEVQYFIYQFDEDDTLLMNNGPEFQEYEERKVDNFEARIKAHMSSINEIMNNCCHIEQAFLQRMVLKLETLCASVLQYKLTLQGDNADVKNVKGKLHDCKELLTEVGLPKHKSRLVDFTDAGPGVGITNHEVKIRSVEEIRIMNYDYYIRHHLAPGDSSHNEVERIQSYVGMSA